MVQEKLLGHTAAHHNGQLGFEIIARISVLIIDRQLHRDAQGHSARDDRNLVDRVGVRHAAGHQGVTRLVISGVPLFLLGEDHRFAFRTHQNFILGSLEIAHQHLLAVLACGQQRRFVDQIGQIGP